MRLFGGSGVVVLARHRHGVDGTSTRLRLARRFLRNHRRTVPRDGGMKPNLASRAGNALNLRSSPPSSMASRRLDLVADADGAARRAPYLAVWEPPQPTNDAAAPTSNVLQMAAAPRLSATLEASLLAIVTRPLRPDESHRTGNDQRERELGTLFASLTRVEAFHLRRQLDLDLESDPIAVAFRRLTGDRRQRLRASLADPRR